MSIQAPTLTDWRGRPLRGCTGTTKDGRPCPAVATRYTDYCWQHDPSRDARRHRAYQKVSKKNTKWDEPQVQMGGRWVSKVEPFIRDHGYVHTGGRFKGQTNMYQLSRESGIAYSLIYNFVHGKIADKVGMITLGKLCGFFKCGPSDLIEWESYPEPPKAPREQLDDDYVSPEVYRARNAR